MTATEAPGRSTGGDMSLWDHLRELRDRLIKVAVALVVMAVVGWFFLYEPALDLLLEPLRATAPEGSQLNEQLLTLDPLEPFGVRLRITGYLAVMLSMPVILWQLWRFIAPGLYGNEKKWSVAFVAAATVLFAIGAATAFWTLPKALDFLRTIGGEGNFTQFYAPAKYLRLVVYMMLAFGVGFEFPILLIFLQIAGIVSYRQLVRFRRYAVVIVALLVAVITPSGDPLSMLALCVPMWTFYELSVLFGFIRARRRRRRGVVGA